MKNVNWTTLGLTVGSLVLTILAGVLTQKQQDIEISEKIVEAVAEALKKD